MECADLTLLILRRNNPFGVNIDLDYMLKKKVINVRNTDFILINRVSENTDFLSLGGKEYVVRSSLDIDVRTNDYRRYMELKEWLWNLLNAIDIVVEPSNVSNIEILDFEELGFYSAIISVDVNLYSLSVGEYVSFNWNGKNYVGMIFNDLGNGNYDIFFGRGQFTLSRLGNFVDLSDRQRGMFKFVYSIEWMHFKRKE